MGFDVLLLTSIWAEPLARIMQEGLASGMVVIGSATGGTAETIVHGENGLLFKAGDAAELADRINLLHLTSLRNAASSLTVACGQRNKDVILTSW